MALFRTGLYVKNHSVEQVQVASTPIASYNGNVTGLYIPELIAYITAKQSGSGTPAPDNIRPISGWSECNVTRCGKNWFTRTGETNGYYVNSSGELSSSASFSASDYIRVKGDTTYTFTTNSASGANPRHCFYDKDKVFISSIATANNQVTFTTPTNAVYMRFSYRTESTNVQLEVGSTATAYEAYTGTTYTIQLGDTYYGGSLDVTTGELTVTDARDKINPNTLGISSRIFTYVKGNMKSGNGLAGMCDTFETVYSSNDYGVRFGANNNTIYFYKLMDNISEITDLATAKQWFTDHDVYVKYPLATPITVQLTPTQIEQLLGTNNVCADTGNVAVKFYNVVR